MTHFFLPLGTLVNVLTVVCGSLIGIFFHKCIPSRIHTTVMQAIGLCTLLIGTQMALKFVNLIFLIFSLLGGAILGELLQLEDKFISVSEKIKQKCKTSAPNFTQGLLTAFLIFCIGSLTILGALEEGINNNHALLYTKATLDGFTAIALSASYGVGVLFSVIPLFIYQTTLTLLAAMLQPFFTPALINQLTAVGGVLIIGLGINLLQLKEIKVTNLLPSLIFVFILKPFL
ncbi:MAG: DUF554 domain-containing protein [Desulfonauticus sp.]|nr:DUF554 domain-containing protein [Desulfonauticus sp.]